MTYPAPQARRRKGFPLRVSLVAAMLVLVALGLVASGIAVTSAMRQSLVTRVDDQLSEAARGWAQGPKMQHVESPAAPGGFRPPSQFYLRFINNAGDVVATFNDTATDDPVLPQDSDVGPVPVSVKSQNGGTSWRAVSVRSNQGLTTLAINLRDVNSTVRSLIWLQVGIGAVVLLVLGAAGYVVVQRSLRPLAQVEATAAAIAAGDLHERVPEWNENTEVGRLAVALNGMLSQIQRAFAATAASEEAARRSEDKMRQFITDASHELRTPLTTIRGFAELYRSGAARDVPAVMSRIEGESARMGGLVEDLLMLARLDAQRPLDRARVDLLSLAADAVHDAKAVAPQRTVRLEMIDGPGTPEVIGDDARLRQVLGNLVTNALRHGGLDAVVRVRVGTMERPGGGGIDAVLEVADDGPGMSAEDAAHVFERFYRTDTSRTRESGGSGLGLSIVAALIDAHGGTVTVDTKPGAGALFQVRLPQIG